jgi:hypothetical protein
MTEQNLNELLGPSGKSDYSVGDTISYMVGGQKKSGTIEHITAPGLTPVSGTPHPTQYWVSSGGFPDVVYHADIIVE